MASSPKQTGLQRAHVATNLKLPSGFAEERSNKASSISNEHSRAAAQACLLINGGAATALLAYLAKDKIDPTLFNTLPFALLFYTIGVASAAYMLYLATEALDEYNKFWFWKVAKNRRLAVDAYVEGDKYWALYRRTFKFTIAVFLVANLLVAGAIWWAPPPQNVVAPSPITTQQPVSPFKK
jgi:hypothetical protein